jgi:phage terminase large subunit-like protein
VFGNVGRDGLRRTRTAFLTIARKQGKSELAAAVALYLLLADNERTPLVVGAAADREQASVVFDVAADMVMLSPELRAVAQPILSRKRIICTDGPSAGGVYRVISADSRRQHGQNVSGIIFDELHTQPDRRLWNVLTTGTMARSQPLIFVTTTAGFDRGSICYEKYNYAKQVLSGARHDDTFVARVFEVPEETTFEEVAETDAAGEFVNKDRIWRAANPSLLGCEGGFLAHTEIETKVREAMHIPAAQNNVMNLYMNVWTQAESRWFSREAWDSCAGLGHTFEEFKGRKAYGGMDLSSTKDYSAVVWVFPPEDGNEDGGYDILCRFWLPEDALEKRRADDGDQIREWNRAGWLEFTPGDVIDYAYIKKRIEEDCALFDVKQIGFDPWHATQLAVELAEGGVEMVPVRQGFRTMSAPSKLLETLVMNRRLNHMGNGVLRWMADNCVIETDPYEAIKPSKKRSTERIDGIAALVTALERASAEEAAPEAAIYVFD